MPIFLQTLPSIFNFLNQIGAKRISRRILDIITRGESFYFADIIYDFQLKSLTPRLLVLLPGKGCEWELKCGGCTMCGFPIKTKEIGKSLSGDDLVVLTKIALLMTKNHRPYNVTIYNGGSFLNPREISLDAQIKILNLFAKHPTIKKIFLESRAEFINDDAVKLLREAAKNKELIIGIGLESQDDKIRNEHIRKGLSKKDYENAIKTLRKNYIRSLTYVLLKPIYLNEKKAIEEAVQTIEYAFFVGSDEVALESVFVQEGTLVERLYKKGEFRPPWLWSVMEVIEKTRNLGPVHIGGFNDEPPPIAIPQNCPKCSKMVEQAIEKYRQTYDIHHLENLDCSCKKEWMREVNKKYFR